MTWLDIYIHTGSYRVRKCVYSCNKHQGHGQQLQVNYTITIADSAMWTMEDRNSKKESKNDTATTSYSLISSHCCLVMRNPEEAFWTSGGLSWSSIQLLPPPQKGRQLSNQKLSWLPVALIKNILVKGCVPNKWMASHDSLCQVPWFHATIQPGSFFKVSLCDFLEGSTMNRSYAYKDCKKSRNTKDQMNIPINDGTNKTMTSLPKQAFWDACGYHHLWMRPNNPKIRYSVLSSLPGSLRVAK